MSFIQFESAREKDAQREAVRKARERILIDVSINNYFMYIDIVFCFKLTWSIKVDFFFFRLKKNIDEKKIRQNKPDFEVMTSGCCLR